MNETAPDVLSNIPSYLWNDKQWIMRVYATTYNLDVFRFAGDELRRCHNFVLECISAHIESNAPLNTPITLFDVSLFQERRFVIKYLRTIKHSRNYVQNSTLDTFFKNKPTLSSKRIPSNDRFYSFLLSFLINIMIYAPDSIKQDHAILRRILKLDGTLLIFVDFYDVSLIKIAMKHSEYIMNLYSSNPSLSNEFKTFAIQQCNTSTFDSHITLDIINHLLDKEIRYIDVLDRYVSMLDLSIDELLFINRFIRIEYSLPQYMKAVINHISYDDVLNMLRRRPDVLFVKGFLPYRYKTDFEFILRCMEFEPDVLHTLNDNEMIGFILSGLTE